MEDPQWSHISDEDDPNQSWLLVRVLILLVLVLLLLIVVVVVFLQG